jgi:hypothetical protein
VPQNKDLKRLVRARMEETGELYTQALAAVLSQTQPSLEPVPEPWFMAGSSPQDYEAGLLPGTQIVQLRLRAGIVNPSGFGTLMQSFAADRYIGRRVRFSGRARAVEVPGWAGLWMRIDGESGRPAAFDNMQDRALRGSTDWADAGIVLDVPQSAVSVHFGVLLHGGGVMEFTELGFGEVDESVAVTGTASRELPDQPAGLDFTVPA